MASTDRDVSKGYSRTQFAAKLRGLADAVETGKSFTLQVAGERLKIPADAVFNIAHERADGQQALEFQRLWTQQ